MVTPKEYAKAQGVAYTTGINWLQNGLVPGAHKSPLPPAFEGYMYQIPEDAEPPKLKPGPKPGSKNKKSAARKSRL